MIQDPAQHHQETNMTASELEIWSIDQNSSVVYRWLCKFQAPKVHFQSWRVNVQAEDFRIVIDHHVYWEVAGEYLGDNAAVT